MASYQNRTSGNNNRNYSDILVQFVREGQYVFLGQSWYRIANKKLGYLAEIDPKLKAEKPMRVVSGWDKKIRQVAKRLSDIRF
jgi:hypothetical protein